MSDRWRRNLLWVDCGAGLTAGALMLALIGWLSPLYGLSRAWILGLCGANALYGVGSLSLALRARRPRVWVHVLALSNVGWGALCWLMAASLVGEATPWGLAHLALEGAFVGGLGLLEWRWRASLYGEPPAAPLP